MGDAAAHLAGADDADALDHMGPPALLLLDRCGQLRNDLEQISTMP
jgi:hypothetical protein